MRGKIADSGAGAVYRVTSNAASASTAATIAHDGTDARATETEFPAAYSRSSKGLAGGRGSLLYSRSSGEMDEWFKSHAWKACIG